MSNRPPPPFALFCPGRYARSIFSYPSLLQPQLIRPLQPRLIVDPEALSTQPPSPPNPVKGSRKRSPRPTKGGGGGRSTSAENADSEPPSTELVGAAAEERGLWLAALRAAVSTVRCSSRFVPAFVQDFESAGGYETVGFMVRRSSIDRLPAMLEQVSARFVGGGVGKIIGGREK